MCQLLEAITATFGNVIVLGRLVIPGNAAATAANVLNHPGLLWWGYGFSLVGVGLHTALAFLFYDLFRHVNRRLSMFAAFMLLVVCATQAVMSLFYVAPLIVLSGGAPWTVFTAAQLQALALMLFGLHAYAFDVNLVFFGCWCLLIGYLVVESTFLPRVLGCLLMISGLGWMTYLYPPLARNLFIPYIAVASAVGEVPLELWLIVKAVDTERWQKQVSGAR